MTAPTSDLVLAAVMEALALMQDQLGTIQSRLDAIDSALAGVTDLEPMLETLLASTMDGQASARKGLEGIARLTAFAHAAASGSPAPLPSDLLSDPLLERFRREMPSDRLNPDRALARWRVEVANAATPDLASALRRQYERSPTDTMDSVALRYRMAAISREELQRRSVAVPEHPAEEMERDTSSAAKIAHAEELAALWRAGPSLHLYGEAELAGAVEVITGLEATNGVDREVIDGMRSMMGDHIAAGQRLSPRLATPYGHDDPFSDRDGPKR